MKNRMFSLLFADEIRFRSKAVVLAAGLVLTICVFVAANGFHGVNLSWPIAYSGDALESLRTVKDIINGDATERLCAPFGYSLKENYFWKIIHLFFYPSIVLIIKIIGWFTGDPVKALNLYYLTTYLLTSFAFIYVAIQLRIPSVLAVPLGVLYTFLPYHYLRGVYHIFPVSYYSVPLIGLVLIWIWSNDPPFFQKIKNRYRVAFINYKGIFCFVFLFFVLPTTFYFNFFGMFLAAVAGISAALYRKKVVHLLSAMLVAFLIFSSTYKEGIYLSIYAFFNKDAYTEYSEGKALSKRGQSITSPGDTEAHSLKPIQLILPVIEHRVEALRGLARFYLETNIVYENKTASLGFIGSVGLIYLLFGLIYIRQEKQLLYKQLAILNIFIILLGTVGGLSSLISTFAGYFLTPESLLCQARSYNRVSVFISFFSLLALSIPLKRFFDKIVTHNSSTKHFRISGVLSALAISCIILIIGIFDQVNSGAKFYNRSCNFPKYESDKDFVNKIERILSKGGVQIFQLPFVIHHPSVGSGYVNQMFYSDHLVGYLHSDKLKWTYEGDSKTFQTSWYRYTAMSPEEKMLQSLFLYDFDGIWIDRHGFRDSGKQIESNLESIIGHSLLISNDGRYAFFDIRDLKRNFLGSHSSSRINELKKSLDQEISKSIMIAKRNLSQHEIELLTHGKVNIPMANNTLHVIGEISILADGTILMFSKVGQIGCMVYGPYLQLLPGKYRVKFSLSARKTDGNETGRVEVSIFDKSTNSVSKVAEKKIAGDSFQDWQEYSIDFAVDKFLENDLYEFRVHSNGRGELFVRDIELEKLS